MITLVPLNCNLCDSVSNVKSIYRTTVEADLQRFPTGKESRKSTFTFKLIANSDWQNTNKELIGRFHREDVMFLTESYSPSGQQLSFPRTHNSGSEFCLDFFRDWTFYNSKLKIIILRPAL
ncbi:hypothetical protein J6590_059872 [Homalodisca vitripennis]|nr:hypothetical protein J6590_059872 [Homalodisca vitripennis]